MKSYKSILIALGILLLLGTYIYYFEKGPMIDSSGSGTPFIKNMDTHKITQISIWGEDTNQLLIQCVQSKDSSWKISAPVPDQGDRVEINGFLMDLKTLKASRVLKKELPSLSEYGLDHPQLVVALTSDSQVKFLVGSQAPGNDTYYVKKENDPAVYLLNTSQVARWFGNEYKFRNKTLVDLSVENINQIQYLRGKDTYSFLKSQEQWKSTQPSEYEINRYKLEDALWKLLSGQVRKFENDTTQTLAEYGLDKPQEIIRLKTNTHQTWELKVSTQGPQPDWVYAKASNKPYVFSIETAVLVPLHFHDLSDLRNKNIYNFMMDDIQTLQWNQPAKLEIHKKGEDWLLSSAGKKAEYGTIQDILTELTNLQADRIVEETAAPLHQYGLDKPTVTITLTDSQQKKYTLWVKVSNNEIYGKSDSQPYLFTLRPETYQLLQLNMEKINKQAGIH